MDLLERAPYLTALGDHLRQAGAGRGVLVLLGGEAGVGKTSLVRRFREDVPPDVRVLAGSCDPISTPRPLGPLLDIAATVGGRFERLTLEATPRHRLFSAFLVELDRQPTPVMTVLEDMHWADEASLDLLRFLGRRLGQVRALVIATYRDDEVGPDHPLRHAIGDLATSVCVRRMQLPPLSPDAVRTLCQDSGLDPEALHRQTGGNPFFVTEALAAGAGVIPITVRDAVLARAARLSERGRAALDAAAVIGASIEPWLLAALDDSACDAVDECIARGVLRVAGNDLAFRHEYVGRFREKKPDWAAFEDAKIEGYKRAQHRFIGAGGSGKHTDPSVIPAKNFTLSIMYVEPGQGNARPRAGLPEAGAEAGRLRHHHSVGGGDAA